MARDPALARNLANGLAAEPQALIAEFEQSMLPTLQRVAGFLDSIAEPTSAPEVTILDRAGLARASSGPARGA